MLSPDKTDWSFEHHPNDSWDGWNSHGTSAFEKNPLQALAREIIQNSLDARRGKEVVVVRFQERTMPEASIPNLDILRRVLDGCSEGAKKSSDKIQKRIKAAKDDAKKSEIRVLSISDTGTKGMPGPCTRESDFYRYLKASGDSGDEEDRAGSYGIGKVAPLCSTNMRSILVSTLWEKNRELRGLIAGRANLSSYKIGKKTYAGVGYWGDDGEPIDPKDCPKEYKWICRKEDGGTGTTIHILGWSPGKENWNEIVLGYVAINYFAALERGDLEVCIDMGKGKEDKLNKSNIKKFFEEKKIINAMQETGSLEKFKESQFFHKCIADDSDKELKSDSSDLEHLGVCEVRMRVESDAPRRIAIIRNNMLITTNFQGFENRIPNKYRECGGVFECEDINLTGKRLLRSMEPPAHDALDPSRSQSPEDAQKALNSLVRYLKERINKYAGIEVPPGSGIIGTEEFLNGEAGDADFNAESSPQSGFSIKSELTKLSTPPPASVQGGSEKVSGGGPGGKNRGKGGNQQGTEGPGNDTNKTAVQPKQVHLLKRRVIRNPNKQGEDVVRVVIKSAEAQKAYLLIDEVGEGIRESLMIKDIVGKKMIRKLPISLKAGEQFSLDLPLSRKIVGGLMLFAEKIASEGEVQ